MTNKVATKAKAKTAKKPTTKAKPKAKVTKKAVKAKIQKVLKAAKATNRYAYNVAFSKGNNTTVVLAIGLDVIDAIKIASEKSRLPFSKVVFVESIGNGTAIVE